MVLQNSPLLPRHEKFFNREGKDKLSVIKEPLLL